MRFSLLIFLFLFSSLSYSNDVYNYAVYGTRSEAIAACNGAGNPCFGGGNLPGYQCYYMSGEPISGGFYTFNYACGSSTNGCPDGGAPDPDQGGLCVDPNSDPNGDGGGGGGDGGGDGDPNDPDGGGPNDGGPDGPGGPGSPNGAQGINPVDALGPDGNPPPVVDKDGNVWNPVDGSTNCDAASGQCLTDYQYEGETVDFDDPSTWPDRAVPSANAPDSPKALDDDGYIDYEKDPFSEPGITGIPIVVDHDTSTQTLDDGVKIERDKKTTLETDGTRITTDKTTTEDPDGTKKTTTKVTTVNKEDNTTTTTTSVTTEKPDGTKQTVITGTTKDDNSNNKSLDPDADPDDVVESSVSGGTDCTNPPVVNDGEAVLTELLMQQWRTRCPNSELPEINSGIIEGEEGITFKQALIDFNIRIGNVPVISGLDSFLSIPSGGSCPVWSVDVDVFSITIDQFCSGSIPWQAISGMIMVISLLIGSRIAFT